MKRVCKYCGKHLVLIGTKRKNGVVLSNETGNDWDDRPYHKKCWKELQKEEDFKEQLRLLREKRERHEAMIKEHADLIAGRTINMGT